MPDIKDNVMMLEACEYDKLSKHCKVFNVETMDYHLWIYLNPDDIRDAYFLGAQEIGINPDNSKIFGDTFVRESTCWIRVNTCYLNNKPGKHTIKLSFVNRCTDTDFSLYVSYYAQVTNPEKPYVYMKPIEEDVAPRVPLSSMIDNGLTPYDSEDV